MQRILLISALWLLVWLVSSCSDTGGAGHLPPGPNPPNSGNPPSSEPNIVWQKVLGGSEDDHAYSVIQTSDGGYLIAANTHSSDGDVGENHGKEDIWLVKLGPDKKVKWKRVYGGNGDDRAISVAEAEDGGYIVVGVSDSTDWGVPENHDYDMLVLRLDENGNLLWKKVLGGLEDDYGTAVERAPDGGYLLVGRTYSELTCPNGKRGWKDFWIVKLDPTGEVQWQECLGGRYNDHVMDVVSAHDGGYLLVGGVGSSDGDIQGEYHGGSKDLWVVKLSESGEIVWQRLLGGSGYDFGSAVVPTSDGGYVIVGGTDSSDGDVGESKGDLDTWVIKLDGSGALVWKKVLGGSGYDLADSVIEAPDGGYVLSGVSASNDGDIHGNHGDLDVWLAKLDEGGNLRWSKCFGGTWREGNYDKISTSIKTVRGGGFFIGTYTRSNDGDLEGLCDGYDPDVWIFEVR